jgi:hypothetical protein
MKRYIALFVVFGFMFFAQNAAAYMLPSDFCYTFKYPILKGAIHADVPALRKVLASRGFLSASNLTSVVFDSNVSAATSLFQEKYSAEILKPNGYTRGTGAVGSATLKKLNALYACKASESVVVISTPPVVVSGNVTVSDVAIRSVNGSPLRKNAYGEQVAVLIPIAFTVNNGSDEVVYVRKDPRRSIAIKTNLDSAASYIKMVSDERSSRADTSASFAILAGGSRPFTGYAVLDNSDGSQSIMANVRATRVMYSTSTDSVDPSAFSSAPIIDASYSMQLARP